MNILRRFVIPVIALSVLSLSACREDEIGSSPAGNEGHITMHIVDNPAQYDAVTIVVTSVEAHLSGADSVSGWVTLNPNGGIYDLLTLRNGASAILADTALAAGKYTQIRLIIGDGSTVTVDGSEYPLTIPSGMETGIKLNHEFTIEAGKTYELTLDFDAEESVVMTGSGEYQLQPVIRVQADAESGSVSGIVDSPEAEVTVYTTVGSDTVRAFPDELTGYFKMMALPAGTYSIMFVPSNGGKGLTLTVEIIPLQNTDLGTIIVPGREP